MSEDPRYPIGRFELPASLSPDERTSSIERIRTAPARLRSAVSGLSAEQLDTPYRDGGWTIRQLAHHVPDSHMNAYVRFKLTLTEEEPVVKPYDEKGWAALKDSAETPIGTSLSLLECLHERWVILMKGLSAKDWERVYRHPENGLRSLNQTLALYAWHGDHHIAHVLKLRERRSW